MSGCKRSCLHRTMVYEYRIARHAQELQREEATGGYETEMKAYPPLITFQEFLRGGVRSTIRFGPPIKGYGEPRRKEGTVPNNVAISTLLLLLILLVEFAYVVHVW